MIKAVIFDMDGVLIDSGPVYLQFDLEFAKTKNPNVKLEDLYGMIGSSCKDAWGYMARATDNGQGWQEPCDEFRQIDVFPLMDYRKIFWPEARALLEESKERKHRLALASSIQMDIIERVLREDEIADHFEVAVTGAMFRRSKPNPEIYHYVAGKLGVKEEECFVVEDSTYGVTAASRAGMTVATLIDERFHFNQSLTDYRIRSLEEVNGLL